MYECSAGPARSGLAFFRGDFPATERSSFLRSGTGNRRRQDHSRRAGLRRKTPPLGRNPSQPEGNLEMSLTLNTLNPQQIEAWNVEQLLDAVLDSSQSAQACLTCSFQAEDLIVLDFLRRRVPQVPVLFLETGYHFAATYEFRDRLAAEWGLNLVNVLPEKTVAQQEAERGLLYQSDPTACCQLRKVAPLMKVLSRSTFGSLACAANNHRRARISKRS